MYCPVCGSENHESSWQCACGHYFAPQPAETPASPPPRLGGRFHFHGEGTTLFGIYIRNLLLTLLTFGVYFFWGKVAVRKYLYAQTRFEGDPFEFHGTGKELFYGALKAFALFGGLIAVPELAQYLAPGSAVIIIVANLAYSIGLLILIPVAIVGSRRYRLSRITWRGLRFSFRGLTKDLIPIFLKGSLLTSFTLGFYYHFFQTEIRRFLALSSYFGSKSFDYDGEGWAMFRIYAVGVLLSVLTFGLYYFWFDAERERYYWDHTTFSTARFRSTVRGHEFLGLAVFYIFLLLFTLGLAYPWVQVHLARFRASRLHLEGPLDLAAIHQEILDATATGEGLADMIDIGVLDVDFGF